MAKIYVFGLGGWLKISKKKLILASSVAGVRATAELGKISVELKNMFQSCWHIGSNFISILQSHPSTVDIFA